MTAMAFGCLILIGIAFTFSPWVSVLTEKIYQTLKTVFDHISKHLEVRQKYSPAHRIYNSLLSVWKACKEQAAHPHPNRQ